MKYFSEKEFLIKYINDNEEEIRIFGDEFVENNKDNCKINYDGNEKKIKACIKNKEKIDIIEIKLIVYKEITDMSYMFYACVSLISLPDISKWNTNNVTNMKRIFSCCIKLSNLPDISNWNINNVIDMLGIFHNCKSLISLPDLSKWNTNNIINMIGIFYCK